MLTVRKLKQAIQHLPDETPVVYAWTWVSPRDLCLGRRRGNGPDECLLLDGNLSGKAKKFGNAVLWQSGDDSEGN